MGRKYKVGQVGLLLLVVMGVVVSLVMSIASRSLSDTVLSRQERESSTAFSLAETGVENALSQLIGNPNLSIVQDTSSFSYRIAQQNTYNMYVKELESATLNVTGASGNLTVSWTLKNDASEDLTCGTEGSKGSAAALEITAINETNSTVISRNYYNSYNCNFSNGFANSNDGGASYKSSISYTLPVGSTMLRIKPIYNGATLSVTGINLPNQQYIISSKADEGDSEKEIQVKRGLEAAPSIFDYAIFAGNTIVK